MGMTVESYTITSGLYQEASLREDVNLFNDKTISLTVLNKLFII